MKSAVFEGGLRNVKDFKRQITANEDRVVILASAKGNNQSGISSFLGCPS